MTSLLFKLIYLFGFLRVYSKLEANKKENYLSFWFLQAYLSWAYFFTVVPIKRYLFCKKLSKIEEIEIKFTKRDFNNFNKHYVFNKAIKRELGISDSDFAVNWGGVGFFFNSFFYRPVLMYINEVKLNNEIIEGGGLDELSIFQIKEAYDKEFLTPKEFSKIIATVTLTKTDHFN